MDGPAMTEDRAAPAQEQGDKEYASVFLTKEQLGDTTYKKGDVIELTVQDVDPETGDVEAKCEHEEQSETRPGYEEAFDKAMPEEA